MKFEIKNRWTNAVIYTGEAGTIREVLEQAFRRGADLSDAVLSDADLSDAVLRKAVLRNADLSGADLSDADLRDAVLREAVLSGADLSDAVLRGADLRGAVLRGADLRNADLSDAVLSGADLSDADLSGADLSDADLRGADLSDADLRGADLSDAVGLEAIRADFFDVLLRASTNGEIPFLIESLKAGKVDGSTYVGACCCLVGTLANSKGCSYEAIPDLVPDSSRPAEVFFTAIRPGDTPENNGAAKIALEWAEEFQRLIARAKSSH